MTSPMTNAGQTQAFAEFAFASQTQVIDASRPLAWLSPEEMAIDLSDPAQRRFGDYELIEKIGQGGMGVVYRARQHGLDRDVAIKLLAAGPWASDEFVERFRREARSAARMQHPNIVEIYEFGHRDGLNYFSMRLIEGRSLAQRLNADGVLPAIEAARLLRTLAEAMDYAHRLGVLHLDLKPANVLLTVDGTPLIADFGLARRIDAGHEGGNDEVSGTPSYMAPEQATLEMHPLTAATDIYGLGAILYETLTGQPPFRGADPQATLQRVVSEDPPRPRTLRKDIPADLEAICLRCLEKDPGQRYANAQALADDLARFVDGRPVGVRPLNRMQRLGRWIKREPRLATAVGIAILALAGGVVATALQWRSARQAQDDAEYLQVAVFFPSARDAAVKDIVQHMRIESILANRRLVFDRLQRSKDPQDWLRAAVIGTYLPSENGASMEVAWPAPGIAPLRRALAALPDDPFALKLLVAYRTLDGSNSPRRDLMARLSRKEPENLFAWAVLMGAERNSPWDFAVLDDPEVRSRVRPLITRAAQADHWDTGYLQRMQIMASVVGDPYVRRPGGFGYGYGTHHNVRIHDDEGALPTQESPGFIGWAEQAYFLWPTLPSNFAVLIRSCDPDRTRFHDATLKAQCMHIARVLADSHEKAMTNLVGLMLLSKLGRGSPVEQEAKERYRRYMWIKTRDVQRVDSDPIRNGAAYLKDLTQYGDLKAATLQLRRFGISPEPPPDWQPTIEFPNDVTFF